jgi:hypothetical protein
LLSLLLPFLPSIRKDKKAMQTALTHLYIAGDSLLHPSERSFGGAFSVCFSYPFHKEAGG